MQQLSDMVMTAKTTVWRSKYAIDEPANAHPMEIILKPGAVPPPGGLPRRNFTAQQHEFLREHLPMLVNMKVISKHSGPWVCPIVLVLKDDQTWRLCVDPSHLNMYTQILIWDMPEPHKDVQLRLQGSKYFTVMDLIKSFWQFELAQNSKHLFSFYAYPYGQFKFERVAMGAKNSSAYVQKTMTLILHNAGLLGRGVEVTTDDIIIHAPTIDQLLARLQATLNTLDEHNLHVHPGKVTLMSKEVKFNDMKISGKGIDVDPARINGLTNMPLPRTLGDVYQFYCAAGWLRTHVPKIAQLIKPLRDFVTNTFKQRKIKRRTMQSADKVMLHQTEWSPTNIKQFKDLQKAMVHSITKAYRDPDKLACIFTDASLHGWSYIITQCPPDELDKPWETQQHEILAVNSGMFKNAQTSWDMCCKEAFPIKECLQKHRDILQGNHPIVSVNDHRNLLYIANDAYRHSTVTMAARHRLARWALFMAEENIRVVHIPGISNHLADLLSRNGNQYHNTSPASATTTTPTQPTGKQFLAISPPTPKMTTTMGPHEHDLATRDIMPNRQDISWPSVAVIAKAQKQLKAKDRKQAKTITIDNRKLYTDDAGKILIPDNAKTLQQNLITLAHQDNHAHRSIDDTIQRLRDKFSFPKLAEKAKDLTHACLQCLKIRGGTVTPRPLWHMMRGTKPYEYIHSDWMDMPTAANGHKYLLIVIDDLSGTVLLHSASTHTAEETARALVDHWLSNYPDPQVLHTDGGSHYVNSIFKAIADIRGFTHHVTAPHAKWSHGVGERINRKCLDSFLQILGQFEVDQNQWPQYTKLLQAQINRTRTKTRENKSPIEITTGLQTKNTFDHLLFQGHDAKLANVVALSSDLVQQHINQFIDGLRETWGEVAKARAKRTEKNARSNRSRPQELPNINIGDYVLVANPQRQSKLMFKWTGPMIVQDTITPFVYDCKPASSKRMKSRYVHVTRIRRFAGAALNMTEQLQTAINRDFPDNEVQAIVGHKTNKVDGQLMLQVQWLGFTKEERTWEPARALNEDVPGHVRAYTHDHYADPICKNFFDQNYC